MKKMIFFLVFLVGCAPNIPIIPATKTQYEQIIEMFTNLHTYKAIATVSYISNKNINQYSTIQIATIDGNYLIEVTDPQNVAGNVTVSGPTGIYQFNRPLNFSLSIGHSDTKERTSILFTNFVYKYLNSNNTSINSSEQFTELTVLTNSQNSYMHSISLIIDNNLNPITLITYDINGEQRIVVNYIEFFYNIEVDTNIFTPQNIG